MKHKKILICCITATLLTILTIIPIFGAYGTVQSYFTMTPDDLGTIRGENNTTFNANVLTKYYIKISDISNAAIILRFINNNTSDSYEVIYNITTENDKYIFNPYNQNSNYAFFMSPTFSIDINIDTDIYIPVYCFNCIPYVTSAGANYSRIYNSTEINEAVLKVEYFNMGYTNGYNNGFDEGLLEGQNIQQYTNLVGYVEQLIGQFTGSSAAQYITPIAIVLVVLFVYFLFIRFLLSLVKAKGIIKTCDIIMIVACIIMLVVMYAPMLDLTIKTEQINVSEETTETVQIRNSNIWIESTETGDIYHGPLGTAIVTRSETIEDVYKITKDIETEAIAYEKD